jgi:flagellar hook-basal body complex protein FliE
MDSPGPGRMAELCPAAPASNGAADAVGEINGAPSFSETLKQSIAEVNQLNLQADKAMQDFASGATEDIQGTITAIQKADISFKLMMEIRNKLVSAYKEVMQTQV